MRRGRMGSGTSSRRGPPLQARSEATPRGATPRSSSRSWPVHRPISPALAEARALGRPSHDARRGSPRTGWRRRRRRRPGRSRRGHLSRRRHDCGGTRAPARCRQRRRGCLPEAAALAAARLELDVVQRQIEVIDTQLAALQVRAPTRYVSSSVRRGHGAAAPLLTIIPERAKRVVVCLTEAEALDVQPQSRCCSGPATAETRSAASCCRWARSWPSPILAAAPSSREKIHPTRLHPAGRGRAPRGRHARRARFSAWVMPKLPALGQPRSRTRRLTP